MSITIAGPACKIHAPEWIPFFNAKLIDALKDRGVHVKQADQQGISPANYNQYNIFGIDVAFNLNNVIVGNNQTKKCVLFTTWYDLPQLMDIIHVGRIPSDQIVIYTGHYDKAIIDRDLANYNVKPWIFRPWRKPSLYPQKLYNPKNNNLFWRGMHIEKVRDFIYNIIELSEPGVDVSFDYQTFDTYNNNILQSGVGLSMSGIRDMCQRDVEYWMFGIPFIRPKFTCELSIEIPTDVYIPIEYEYNYQRYFTPAPNNSEKLASDIINKYREVKNNHELLRDVSCRGHQFYKENFTVEKIIDRSIKILEQEDIL